MTSRELLLEFLKFHYKQNPLRKQETNEKDIENFMAELPADFETKNAPSNFLDSGSALLAVEFGYKQCEKGNNLEMALAEFKKLHDNDR